MLNLTPEQEAVLEKAEKMFALAKSTTSEHEAENAMRLGLQLLEDHNLDMAIIDQKSGAKAAGREDKKQSGGLYQWQRDLWSAVADLNMCRYWSLKGLARGSKYEHRVLGSKVNVVSTRIMAEYLQGAVDRMAKDWAKQRAVNFFARECLAYKEGVAKRLVDRLKDARAQRIEEDARKQREAQAAASHPSSAPGTALVLANVIATEQDLNEDFLLRLEPGTTARHRAEGEARRAAHMAEYQAKIAARDAAELADPSLKEARLAAEEAQRLENNKYYEKSAKREEQRIRRAEREGRDPYAYRYRAPTAAEQRAQMPSHWQGQRDGDQIGLDRQIDEDTKEQLT